MDTKKLTAFVAVLTLIVIAQGSFLVYTQMKQGSDPSQARMTDGGYATPLGQSSAIGISTESKLDDKNFGTQVKKVDGKKKLEDRRLLINNLKSENISSLSGFATAFAKMEKYVEEQGVTMEQSDRDVIVELYKREKIDTPICSYFSAAKDTVKKNEGLFKALEKACK